MITVPIIYNETPTTIQAHNKDGIYITTINNMAITFGDVKVGLRVALETVGYAVDWDNEEGLVIVGEPLPQGISQSDFDYLARIVHAEANGEDMIGQILVVNVILNRMVSNCRDFRNAGTIREVITQRNANGTWQFSPLGDGSFARAVPNQVTKEAVQRALNGEDHSQGALWFRGIRGVDGSWHDNNLRKLFDHGGHRFYATT